MNWKVKKVKLSDIKEYEANPRKFTEKGLSELRESYRKFGQMHPVVINTDMTLIGGHAGKIVMTSLDYEYCDAYVPDRKLTDKEVQEANIRLNKNIAGEFDFDILNNFFGTDDLLEWGFEGFEFKTQSFENQELDVNEMEDEMKITLKFTSEDYWIVKKCFEVAEKTPEEVLLDYAK